MKYFILDSNSQQLGPFSIYELKDRGISEQTLVWTDGMPDWQPAWKVEEIKKLIFDQPTGTPPPPPHTEAAPQQAQPAPQPERKKPWAAIISIVVVVVLLLILTLTNPDRRDHEDAITRTLTETIDDQARNTGMFEDGFGQIGRMIADRMTSSIVEQLLEYHNYVLFSKSTVTLDKKSYTVSWGVLGHVFTVSNETLDKQIEKNINLPQVQSESTVIEESSDSTGDSVSLSKKGTDKIVDGVSDIVKDQVEQSTDSATSSAIGRLIDEVKDFFK
ncbi:MAG: GYF domain-containing protein [Prevotella sp.]|jgi:hypothetical protein